MENFRGFLLDTGLFGLEGTSQDHMVQSSPLKPGQLQQFSQFPKTSSQVLNMSEDRDWRTSLGNLFQSLLFEPSQLNK